MLFQAPCQGLGFRVQGFDVDWGPGPRIYAFGGLVFGFTVFPQQGIEASGVIMGSVC